jgi:hypothetical protein
MCQIGIHSGERRGHRSNPQKSRNFILGAIAGWLIAPSLQVASVELGVSTRTAFDA